MVLFLHLVQHLFQGQIPAFSFRIHATDSLSLAFRPLLFFILCTSFNLARTRKSIWGTRSGGALASRTKRSLTDGSVRHSAKPSSWRREEKKGRGYSGLQPLGTSKQNSGAPSFGHYALAPGDIETELAKILALLLSRLRDVRGRRRRRRRRTQSEKKEGAPMGRLCLIRLIQRSLGSAGPL